MRNFLITAAVLWGCGFFMANFLANAVDNKLDQMQAGRIAELCRIDSSFCDS